MASVNQFVLRAEELRFANMGNSGVTALRVEAARSVLITADALFAEIVAAARFVSTARGEIFARSAVGIRCANTGV
jgi:hypothetical protein